MEHAYLYILLASALSLALAFSVGANDLANIMSTTMGSKAVSVRQAMLIAVVFEFAGAFLGSHGVTHTLQSGIIDLSLLTNHTEIFIYGMLAALTGSTLWMLAASILGLPVSITNAIVGSIVGFGGIILGAQAVHWQQVSYIALSWVCSPTLSGVLAYVLFMSVQRLIFDTSDPLSNAFRFLPLYFFLVGVILGDMTLLKGLKHFHIEISLWPSVLLMGLTGLITMAAGKTLVRGLVFDFEAEQRDRFVNIEKMFAILMAFTACAMVFAHGSNDVAIAVGPLMAIIRTIEALHPWHPTWFIEYKVVALGCCGILLGLFIYGKKVIATVGTGITALTPSRAFAATLAAAITVILSTSTGIPVSATQTLVGAVLGVGLARGIGSLNLTVVRNIIMSWIFTLPAACAFTIIFYMIFSRVFS
ncbi:MAG: inorganic phosphate transporter [Gammaproteobacteria bacterium]|nr:inorganic phosphate transporter [Gammaproteobacteria bacterium]